MKSRRPVAPSLRYAPNRTRRLALERLDQRMLLAGDLELLKDIGDYSTPLNSNPTRLISVGSKVFFAASTPVFGEELWVTDGTEAGTQLVRDIAPGSNGSTPRNMLNMNGLLVFTANDGSGGEEIWRSDGTTAGTFMIKDVNPGSLSSSPASLTLFQGAVLFAANDGVKGVELWRSDGTNAGTSLLADVQPGSLGANPVSLTAVGSQLFFNAFTSATGSELWTTDGTTLGTRLVVDARTGTPSSSPQNLTNIGGTLYFSADNGSTGFEPWTSDGTTAGTQLLADLETGPNGSRPSNFFDFSGQAIFAASRTGEGVELWTSNGTPGGTSLLKEINPGTASSNPSSFRRVGGILYFAATQAATGTELWSTDGTTTGTNILKDIVLGSNSGLPSNLVDVGGVLHFTYNESLWKSDGTPTGTVNLPIPSPITTFVASGGVLYFAGRDGSGDTELWRSDTTAAGTYVVKNINNENASSNPTQFVEVNGKLFFTALSSLGNELWASDGSAAGTQMVKDIGPGFLGSSITTMLNFNGTLFFVESGALWRSDGTDPGTFPVVGQIGSSISGVINPVVVGNHIFFSAMMSDGSTGAELFKSDGTAAGTSLVKDIRFSNASSSPFLLTNVNGTLFFTAHDGSTGTELWRSDGTTAGTVLVRDMTPGPSGSYPQSLTDVNGILYMTALGQTTGFELWRSNGTQAGTFLVKDILPGAGSSSINSMRNINGKLMFNASDGVNGGELWTTDGTNAGTFMVRNIAPGNQSAINILAAQGNFALFFANDGVNGSELWKSDGTFAGTTFIKDIFPGPASSFVNTFAARSQASFSSLGNQVYFAANDGIHGQEIWRTDGTSDNTVLVDDITGDSGGARPTSMAVVAGRLFVSAGRGDVGVELFSRNPMSPPTAIQLSSNTILETATSGTLIGTLSSSDVDVGDTWSYALVTGAGSTNNNLFSITGDQLVLANFPPNLAGQPTYSIRVRSIDSEGNFFEQSMLLDVISVAPEISIQGPTNILNPVAGQEVFYTATVSDPGNGPGPYTVRIDWDGDGSWDESTIGDSPLQLAHSYSTSGSFLPRFQALDPDGPNDSSIVTAGTLQVSQWAVQGNTLAVGGSDGGSEDDLIVVEPGTIAGQFIVRLNGVNLQTPPATTFSLAGLGVTQVRAYSGGGVDRLVLRGNSSANSMTGDGDSRTLILDLATDLIASGDTSIEQLALEGLNGNDTFTLRGNIEALGGAGNDLFLIQDGSSPSQATLVNGETGTDTLSYSLWTSAVEASLNNTSLGTGASSGNVQFTGIESYRGTSQVDVLHGPLSTATWIISGNRSGSINGRTFFDFDELVGSSAVDSFRLTTSASRIGSIDGVGGNDTISVIVASQNSLWELSGADSGTVRNELSGDVLAQINQVRNWTGNNAQKDTLRVLTSGSLSGRFTAGTGSPIDMLDYSLFPGAVINLQASNSSNVTSILGFDSYQGDGSNATLIGRNAAATWAVTGPNTGSLVQTTTSIFLGISHLTGGSLDDTFVLADGASVSGTLQAGNGVNVLSYAGRSSTVLVDFSLATPTATDIGTVLDNFAVIMGGNANDILQAGNLRGTVLIGNAGDDLLSGGSQRDVLFGGTGADNLQGGGNDDILFGATTLHDADIVGLKKIRAEWISSHLYANRIAYLQGTISGGLNGTYLLTNNPPDRLLDDGEVDVLLGQLGRDWFLWDPTDAALSDLAVDELVSPS